MIVGIDVTHSGREGVPSIAAMVATHDAYFAQWPASIKGNPRRDRRWDDETYEGFKAAQEKIARLREMLEERLDCFQAQNDALPDKIIFYRDGLSEGQFEMCKREEIPQLRRATEGRYADRKPPKIMAICAVKRRHTRFYRKQSQAHPSLTNHKGQIESGVVVYEKVTYGRNKDFYLASQNSALGICRPTHHVVLHSDFKEEGFNVTHVAEATHQLSYLFGRCSCPVGLVPAAYYADLACDRARCYARAWYTGGSPWTEQDEDAQAFDFNLGDLSERIFYI